MSTPIERENIRKGDRVRMVVTSEFTAACDLTASDLDEGDTETYELIRRAVVLPGELGTVVSFNRQQGDGELLAGVAVRTGKHGWLCPDDKRYMTNSEIAGMAGLRVLRPVAEVAAEVLADVRGELDGTNRPWRLIINEAAAKWATK